jgi:hypothetical protein
VAGIKTFSSFPVTPNSAPTTDYQAANKKYVDDRLATPTSTYEFTFVVGELVAGILTKAHNLGTARVWVSIYNAAGKSVLSVEWTPTSGATTNSTDIDLTSVTVPSGQTWSGKISTMGIGAKGDAGAVGPEGPQGDPGEGVPAGGTTGQVLTKQSGTDYDADWETPTGGSGGINYAVSAHGNQSGTLNCSIATYAVHSMTVTGNLAITTTDWPISGIMGQGIYFLENGGAYTVTIDGLSFSLNPTGWTMVTVVSIDAGATVLGGLGGSVISAGGWE